jgi:arylsulfatase A-like enzyme
VGESNDDRTPANAIVVLLDSLNRHMLGCYGGQEFATPNLDRFAARAMRFTRHYAGSLPCMPARHDLLCGALDFPWKPWGSIELWEEPITAPLRRAGVVTQLISDHPHLFETGGENYHCDFGGWDYLRGHETDHWKTRADPSWIGAPSFRRGHMPYDDSRGWFRGEDDFPGPRTMDATARWLDDNAAWHDRFLLFVDEFDPHEPFDTPARYASMYDPDWDDAPLIWPPYVNGGVRKGVIDERMAQQIRACYGAKLTMIDHWFGRVLDAVDRHGLWHDTVIIVCTDHGHYLGEKDIWGKPGVPMYEPLGRIPLMISWPGVHPGTCDALTTAVDLHATLLDLFDVPTGHAVHGTSLRPLLTGDATSVREHALAGVWGREVHLLTSDAKYIRAPQGENEPLSMWSNRWSTMPVHGEHEIRLPPPDGRAVLDHMPGSTIPVIRQPFQAGDFLPFWAYTEFDGSRLFFPDDDPNEARDLAGDVLEATYADQLADALRTLDAPDDQLARLGLA